MKLIDLIDTLEEFDDNLVIFVPVDEPLQPSIDAITVLIDVYLKDEEPPEGLEYFIEVELAKDVIRVWQEWREGRVPDKHEKYQAVIYYAQHDAYMPTDEMIM